MYLPVSYIFRYQSQFLINLLSSETQKYNVFWSLKLFQNAIHFFAEHFPNDGPDPFVGYTNNLGKLCKMDVQVFE